VRIVTELKTTKNKKQTYQAVYHSGGKQAGRNLPENSSLSICDVTFIFFVDNPPKVF
jgi:hypothetical protein